MTTEEIQKEIAAISAVISDTIFKRAYEYFNGIGNMGGYVYTAYELADWAVEFEQKHRDINWEEVLEKGYPKLSKEFTSEIICWDDAIMDFALFKLEQAMNK